MWRRTVSGEPAVALQAVRDLPEALQAFRASLAATALDDREGFRRAILQGQALLGVSQAELASWFQLSRATVNRWSTGDSAPYPGLRKVVFERLARRAAEQQKRLQRQSNGPGGRVVRLARRIGGLAQPATAALAGGHDGRQAPPSEAGGELAVGTHLAKAREDEAA